MQQTRDARPRSTAPCNPPGHETISRWLAAAHRTPSTVREEWNSAAKLAMIPLGRRFDAVRIPEAVVHTAAGSAAPPSVDAWLRLKLDGPVIHDPGFGRYYVLVPPGTAEEWPYPPVECLTEGTFLGVPPAHHTERDERTRSSYWSVPMTRPGSLCMAFDVLALVRAGSGPAGNEEGST